MASIDGNIKNSPFYNNIQKYMDYADREREANEQNNKKLQEDQDNQSNIGIGIEPDIVRRNPGVLKGKKVRETMIWRVPGLGFVNMYINPQKLTINEGKIIKKQRTKGGYIIQYWGEELIKIDISGSTGAAGIEGIEILRKVYRSEQDAFQQVEATMLDRFKDYTSSSAVAGIVNKMANGQISGGANGLLNNVLGGSANPPLLPTLGSLAVSVELYYHGWVFKGFFESFVVNESVDQGVGVFAYDIKFVVLDRRGVRKNFMPWHRSPATFDPYGNPSGYNRSDANSVPLTFNGEKK